MGDGVASASLRERDVWIYGHTGRAVTADKDFTSFDVWLTESHVKEVSLTHSEHD